MTNSPLTINDTEWDEEAVFAYCFSRITMTDEEWSESVTEWDISREEAATRIDEGDFSAPDFYQADDDDS